MRTFTWLLLVTTVASASVRQNQNPSSADAAIRAASQAWADAWERGDVDALMNLFEEDAIYAANTGEVLRGREGIGQGVRGWMAARPPKASLGLDVQTVRVQFHGDTADTVSRFVMRLLPAGCSIQSGHGLSVWRRQPDGRWLIATHLVNRAPQPLADACPQPAALMPAAETLAALRSHPRYDGEPVVLVNLLDFVTAEARSRYFAEYAAQALRLVGAHGGSVLWSGPVDQHLVGTAGGEWDYLVLVRWPSRAAFVRMLESDDYRALHRIRQETLRSTAILVASDPARR